MVNSQNGWPAHSDKRKIAVETFVRHGVSFPGGVRAGDVATVLGYVVDRFHREVEPLTAGWCWGWAWRAVRGGASTSNHASGTAVDVNAPRHPLGKAGTFTPKQTARIRDIVRACGGTVRWGGDYSSRKDEMHFEINASAASVAAMARTIRAGQQAPPATNTGDDMRNLVIMHEKTNRATYVGNGVTRRHIKNATELADLKWWIQRAGGDPTDHEVADGHLAGVLGVDVTPAESE